MVEVEVLWANHDELLISNGEKKVTVKKKWFDTQLKAGNCKVNSLKVLCIDKSRDKNNNIVAYLLKDNTGNTCVVSPEKLKHAIMYYQVDCVNLTLTSDNRLIDKAVDNVKESNVKDLINSANHNAVQNVIYRITSHRNEIARLQKIVILIANQDYMSDEYVSALTQKQFNYYMKAAILYEALIGDKITSTEPIRQIYNENKAYIDKYDFTNRNHSKNQSAVDEAVIANALEGRYLDWFYKVCKREHKVIVFGDILNRLDYALLEYIGLALVKADKELSKDYELHKSFCVELLLIDISDENVYKALREKALELREDYQYLDFIRGLAEAINEK